MSAATVLAGGARGGVGKRLGRLSLEFKAPLGRVHAEDATSGSGGGGGRPVGGEGGGGRVKSIARKPQHD